MTPAGSNIGRKDEFDPGGIAYELKHKQPIKIENKNIFEINNISP